MDLYWVWIVTETLALQTLSLFPDDDDGMAIQENDCGETRCNWRQVIEAAKVEKEQI